ncbi:MAG: hypothetical protein WA782_00625 [Sulfitobacter sp.]
MFNTLSFSQIEHVLDLFSVPMFVIERQEPANDFRLVGMNAALEQLVGQPRSRIHGRFISEICLIGLPDNVQESFQRCIAEKEVVHFTYLFLREGCEVRWDTTLQYACGLDELDRVIVTTLEIPQEHPLMLDRLAFEDVRYFSSIADLQLQNLNSAFSSATTEARVTPIDEERIMQLHTVCRTVHRSVADIQDIVRRAQARHAALRLQPTQKPLYHLEPLQSLDNLDTVRAFAEAWETKQDEVNP